MKAKLSNFVYHTLIIPLSISKTDIFTCFEFIFQSMTNHLIDKRDETGLIAYISYLAQFYVNSSKPSSKDIMAHKF